MKVVYLSGSPSPWGGGSGGASTSGAGGVYYVEEEGVSTSTRWNGPNGWCPNMECSTPIEKGAPRGALACSGMDDPT